MRVNLLYYLCRFQALKPRYEKFAFLSDEPPLSTIALRAKAAPLSSLNVPTFHVDAAISAGVSDHEGRWPEEREANSNSNSEEGLASRTPSEARGAPEQRPDGSGENANATAGGVVRGLLHHMRIALLALDAVLIATRIAAICHVLLQLWHGLPVLGAPNPDSALRLLSGIL